MQIEIDVFFLFTLQLKLTEISSSFILKLFYE